ncbi:porin [Amphritea pacifica]|uniref:Porin n=1 Tax=Amphritea pacifica TaxID=2811233 RepID=A0ABS2WD00_9GAMM|nr:porin [Amphritea pacifica]MBN0989600.1 porin [Amphritea pacifica]MBN1008710.1 porin [Amphritea pacifica]
MKKLILAAAIAATTAGSASAATIYEGKGLTYKLKGDFQIQLRKDVGKDQNLNVDFDDLELKNSVIYDLGNDMKAFGQLDFGYKNAANGKDKESSSQLEEAYVGMQFGNVSVSVGQQNFAVDSFGVDEQLEDELKEDRFDATATDGNDVVRVDVNMDNFTLILSTELEADGEKSADGKGYDLFVSTSVAGVELGAAYQTFDEDPSTSGDVDVWGVSAMYDAGFAEFGVDYSKSDDGTVEASQYNVITIIPVAATTDLGLGLTKVEEDGQDDVSEWYVNVVYKFPTQKNVSVFAEIADTDEDGVKMGYLAGMRLKF